MEWEEITGEADEDNILLARVRVVMGTDLKVCMTGVPEKVWCWDDPVAHVKAEAREALNEEARFRATRGEVGAVSEGSGGWSGFDESGYEWEDAGSDGWGSACEVGSSGARLKADGRMCGAKRGEEVGL